MRHLAIHSESWACARPFRISTGVSYSFDSVVLELAEGPFLGRGAAMPVTYMGESLTSVRKQLQDVRIELQRGIGRAQLLNVLPAGAARNAADAALWDLEAQQQNFKVWDALGVNPDPVQTVFTIGLEDTPELMAAKAAEVKQRLLKIKLDEFQPVERVAAIRRARPDAELIVDANQAWSFEQLCDVAPKLHELGVKMLEQPLPRGADQALGSYQSPVPLCADESCQHLEELDALPAGYQFLNIKLDKAGGLTHAWTLAQAARAKGLELMMGCMGGQSLCVAPAFVLAQICRYVDIDGPLLLKADQPDGLVYVSGSVSLPGFRLWGRRGMH